MATVVTIKMKKKHIPSHLTIMGHRVLVSYDGQPSTCYGCGDTGHIYQTCLRRRKMREVMDETTTTWANVAASGQKRQELIGDGKREDTNRGGDKINRANGRDMADDEVENTHTSPSLHFANEQICYPMPEKDNVPDMAEDEGGLCATWELHTESHMEQEGNGKDEAPADKIGTPHLKQLTEWYEETKNVRKTRTRESGAKEETARGSWWQLTQPGEDRGKGDTLHSPKPLKKMKLGTNGDRPHERKWSPSRNAHARKE
jgi:hypothetical protein